MQLRAIEPHDRRQPGEEFEVGDRQGAELIKKGLAKMIAPTGNKMAPKLENKANPSVAVGRVRTSSASPAARVSAKPTAQPSDDGAPKRKYTRRAESS